LLLLVTVLGCTPCIHAWQVVELVLAMLTSSVTLVRRWTMMGPRSLFGSEFKLLVQKRSSATLSESFRHGCFGSGDGGVEEVEVDRALRGGGGRGKDQLPVVLPKIPTAG
jgi:hypothetical protein